MQTVDAIYTGGTFKPLGNVSLAENQQVRLTVQSRTNDWAAIIADLRAHRESLQAQVGILPDSTLDIRADRDRHD